MDFSGSRAKLPRYFAAFRPVHPLIIRSLIIRPLIIRSLIIRSLIIRSLIIRSLIIRSLIIRSLIIRSLIIRSVRPATRSFVTDKKTPELLPEFFVIRRSRLKPVPRNP